MTAGTADGMADLALKSDLAEKLATAMEEDLARGIYRANRSIFYDPELFELEMKYIFEGNWIYLAHESQIKTNEYITLKMGRQPIFIARNRAGELNAIINACSHRGAMLCRRKKDTRSTITCPFHGWTFNNSGKLLKVKDPGPEAGYPEQFNTNGSHDLTKVPRFESYRGFLFGSLNPDVVPLREHLGEAAKIIDMLVDQSPDGLEVLRGASTYTFDGNWKVQAENGADGYHVSATHWNYAATTGRRGTGDSATETKAMDVSTWQKQKGGFYSFENGHLLLWMRWGNPQDRPIYPWRERLVKEYGAGVGGPDRGHHLLRRAQGRVRGDAGGSAAPVRGLLQRDRHGHPRRLRGVPLVPAGVPRPECSVERHEPRRHPLDQRPGRRRQGAGHQPDQDRGAHRGRGVVPPPARLLAADHEKGRGRRGPDFQRIGIPGTETRHGHFTA